MLSTHWPEEANLKKIPEKRWSPILLNLLVVFIIAALSSAGIVVVRLLVRAREP